MTAPLVERLRPALKLVPVECHDTPYYAEATGEQFQAMTMVPDAFLALNELPAALDALALCEKALEALVECFIKRGPFDEPLGSSEQAPSINAAVEALAILRGESHD